MAEQKFTPRAENVLRLAQETALELGHGYVGCEHILLGLLREDGGAAYNELKSLREYTAPDGQTYTMRFKPGFYSIVNANGDTVYASTSLDKMVVLCLPLDIIGTIWFTMFCFMRSSRLRRELQGTAE